jgi:hypothetical protein
VQQGRMNTWKNEKNFQKHFKNLKENIKKSIDFDAHRRYDINTTM